MSPLSSLVITSSSTLTLDFIKDKWLKNLSGKGEMLLIRAMCAASSRCRRVGADPERADLHADVHFGGALGGAFLAPFLYACSGSAFRPQRMASFALGVGLCLGNAIFHWMSPITAAPGDGVVAGPLPA